MRKAQYQIAGANKRLSIEGSFKKKESNEFYKHYHGKGGRLIRSWNQLLHCYYEDFAKDGASKWLFRGDVFVCRNGLRHCMKDAFKTSLDKAFEEFDIPPDKAAGRKTLRNKIEKHVLRGFRRRAHLLTADEGSPQTYLEALALLRHHGGPARILDWMYSFFPAVYLAINRYDGSNTYTLWALNREWVNTVSKSLEEDFLNDTEYLARHFEGKKKRLEYLREYQNNQFQNCIVAYIIDQNSRSAIYAATPYRFNERLVAQRGTLLLAGTVDRTWGENLRDKIDMALKNQPLRTNRGKKIEGPILCEIPLELTKGSRNEFLKRLDEMNINQASLFPDLDGFAQSLRTRIAHPESLGIDVGENE